jgi:hypothetical protein
MEEKQYHDIKIECVNCQNEFYFTAGEQKFYEKMKFVTPRRCAACRKERGGRSNRGAEKQPIGKELDEPMQ